MTGEFTPQLSRFLYIFTVTVREAGKCSVSHRSYSASMCAAHRQPELLLFHPDHSSLPWMRMLKLTGLSFSSPVSCSQALFLILERRSSAHSLCLAEASACFPALSLSCFFVAALLSWFCSVVLSLLSPRWRLPFSLSLLFIYYLPKKEMGD